MCSTFARSIKIFDASLRHALSVLLPVCLLVLCAQSAAAGPSTTVTLTLERDAAYASYKFNGTEADKAYYTLTEFLDSAQVTSDPASPPHVYGWLRQQSVTGNQQVIVGVAHNDARSVRIKMLNTETPKYQSEQFQSARVAYTLGFPGKDPVGDLDARLQGLFSPVKKLIVITSSAWADISITPKPGKDAMLPGRAEIDITGPGQITVYVTPTGGISTKDVVSLITKNGFILAVIVGLIATISHMTRETPYSNHVRAMIWFLAIGSIGYNMWTYFEMPNIASFLREYTVITAISIALAVGAIFFNKLEDFVKHLKSMT